MVNPQHLKCERCSNQCRAGSTLCSACQDKALTEALRDCHLSNMNTIRYDPNVSDHTRWLAGAIAFLLGGP